MKGGVVARRKKTSESDSHEMGMIAMVTATHDDNDDGVANDIESGHSGGEPLMNYLLFSGESSENSSMTIPTSSGGRNTFLKPIAETTPMERAMAIIAICTVTLGILVMFSTPIFFAGICSSIMGGCAYYQQTRLTDVKVLQETKEACEREVDRLHAENGRLSSNISKLSTSVERLEDIDEALKVITETQGQSVLEFENQAKEAKEILEMMKLNNRAAVLQNLLNIILLSDTDGDFVMDENEIDKLISRIQGIGGVEVHEGRFRSRVQDKDIDSIMSVMQNLLSDNVPSDEKIFFIQED